MNTQPLARRTDPLSSYLAADRAKEFAGSHKEKIMQAMSELVQGTASDISKKTRLSIEQVDRRAHELIKAEMLGVAQCGGIDFIRDGFRVIELPMTDSQREDWISTCAAVIEASPHRRDTNAAGKANKLMTGLIKCRSQEQIKKMEIERGLV